MDEPEASALAAHSHEWVTHEILPGIDLKADLTGGYFFLDGAEDDSPETITHCLYDLAVPRLLAFDGNLVIHGGLSFGPTGAIGFIAPSGRGKSTIVAGLSTIGLHLMGDDAFILQRSAAGYDAQRVFPSLRLFPDSLDSLIKDDRETTLVADYSTKRRVPFTEGPDTAPLVALFQIGEPASEISVRELSMAECCMSLVSNSFVLDVGNIDETKTKFKLASTAAPIIPIYNLSYPRDYARLPDVYDAILDTISRISDSTTES